MNILFDFISMQGRVTGGGVYTKIVLNELYDKKRAHENIQIFGLFDSQKTIGVSDSICFNTCFDKKIDINKFESIKDIVKRNDISVFFIGILQRYIKYDLNDIDCRVISILHDLSALEIKGSKLYLLKPRTHGEILKEKIKKILSHIIHAYHDEDYYFHRNRFALEKDNFQIVTVSEFSKASIYYYLPFLKNKNIKVLFSPLRDPSEPKPVTPVKKLVDGGNRFFLILSSDRWLKNAKMAIEVLRIFCDRHSDYYLVTTGNIRSQFNNHIALHYVDDSELAYLLCNAYALIYPTIIEGFGYPPIEAMRYGTPVLSSGFSSIPEVIGESNLYFSPFYRSDLMKKLEYFIDNDIDIFRRQAFEQYKTISSKQREDLKCLIKLIVDFA